MVARFSPEILLYHRVGTCSPDNQYLSVSPENFEAHLAVLTAERKVLPLFDLVQAALKGHLVEGAVAISFDDGYADNLIHALPLLEKYRCHATIFVTAGMLGNGYGFWYDVLEDVLLSGRKLPSQLYIPVLKESLPLASPEEILGSHDILLDLCKRSPAPVRRVLLHELVNAAGLDPAAYTSPHPLLTQEQLRTLASSPWIEIGAHTLNHPVLSMLDDASQRREIAQSAEVLTNVTGKAVRMLAYPFGDAAAFNDSTQRITKECGLLGIANIQGNLSLGLNPQAVPRRLVRQWTGAQFRSWLRAGDRAQLERETVDKRADMLLRLLRGDHGHRPQTRHGVDTAEHPLRVTHLNTTHGKGGAATVMRLLHEVQQSAGHTSQLLVGRVDAGWEGSASFHAAPDAHVLAQSGPEGLLYCHYQGSHSLTTNPLVDQAQVLHFHNMHSDYFNPWSLALLSRFRPSVWTMHDMFGLTGHCAHSFDCTRWQTGCGLCPNLGIYPAVPVDNTHRLWRDKERIYSASPVHLVTPSQWLANHVKKGLLAEHQLSVIPNGIDTQVFAPADKAKARARLGIAEDALVVGNAAHDGPLHNYWKGGAFAVQALDAVRARHPEVLFLGRGNTQESTLPNVRLLPYAFTEQDMVDFYAALDILLYPSLADNCPLVVLEALACGVPVLAFDVGGVPELVEHGISGLLSPARDGESLCQHALRLAGDAALRQSMGQAARQRAENLYDVRLMAKHYQALYESMLEQWQSLPQAHYTFLPHEIPAPVRTRAFMSVAEKVGLFGAED